MAMVGHYMLRFKYFNHGTCTPLIKQRLKKNMICGLPVQRNTLACEKQNRYIINLSFDIFDKNNHKYSRCKSWNGAPVLHCRSTHRFLIGYKHVNLSQHDDVIKWKHFPRYWPFVRGIHRSPVNYPHKGQ